MKRLNLKQSKLSQWCALSLLAMTTLVSVAQADHDRPRYRERRVREIVSYSCMLRDDFDSSYVGHGQTEMDAQADASAQCQKNRSAMFCQNQQTCDKSVTFEHGSHEYDPDGTFSCALQDDFGSTYIGHGDTQMDAVADASAQCEKSRSPMFCKNAPQCESTGPEVHGGHHDYDNARGYTCELKDDFGVSYLGHGKTSLDARADVVSNCQSQRSAMFCEKEPQCEATRR